MSIQELAGLAQHPRQRLTDRQVATVNTLIEAALAEVRASGYDQLTIRAVATRAGVTHTTAYSYFASKAHLVAEVFWRRLQEVPRPAVDPGAPLVERVRHAIEGPALIFDGEPELTHATTSALLSTDPETCRLRDVIGRELAERIDAAAGPDLAPEVGQALLLAFSGAMVQAGMGYLDFAGVVERMASFAQLLDRGTP
jgi:TetR/AcrR family transcriptional regulator, cholesterol catabolism regulator